MMALAFWLHVRDRTSDSSQILRACSSSENGGGFVGCCDQSLGLVIYHILGAAVVNHLGGMRVAKIDILFLPCITAFP